MIGYRRLIGFIDIKQENLMQTVYDDIWECKDANF